MDLNWFLCFSQVHTGRWLVDGNPQIILMDIGSVSWRLDEFKAELWNTCNIGVPHLDIETNDSIILGFMVANFLAEVKYRLHYLFCLKPANYR